MFDMYDSTYVLEAISLMSAPAANDLSEPTVQRSHKQEIRWVDDDFEAFKIFQYGIEVGINYLVRYNRDRQEYITQIQLDPTRYRSLQKGFTC